MCGRRARRFPGPEQGGAQPVQRPVVRSQAALALLGALLLFAVNWYIAGKLAAIEYLHHMQSIEGAFIALSRFAAENWRDLSWFPWWYGGIPAQNAYFPLLPIVTAAFAGLTGSSPALSFHAVCAFLYCLGPVTLFWMALRLSRMPGPSFVAGLLYSLTSPSALLIPAIRQDLGGAWYAQRLHAMVFYGDGPFVCSLTLLPLAVICLDAALRRRPPLLYLAGRLLDGCGGSHELDWGRCAGDGGSRLPAGNVDRQPGTRWWAVGGVGLLAYALASPLMPPSTISTIQNNAHTIAGYYPRDLAAACLRRRAGRRGRFAASPVPEAEDPGACTNVSLLRAGHRLRHSLRRLGRHRSASAADPLPPCHGDGVIAGYGVPSSASLAADTGLGRWVALLLILVLCLGQAHNLRRYAGGLIRPIDIRATTEYKTALWFDRNMQRRQGHGARLSVLLHERLHRHAATRRRLRTRSAQLGEPRRPVRALHGTERRRVGRRDLRALAEGFWRARRGRGRTGQRRALQAVSQSRASSKACCRRPGATATTTSTRSRAATDSLAHVVGAGDLVSNAAHPRSGCGPGSQRYVAALEDPELPLAQMNWTSRHSARIVAELRRDQRISVQVTYHPGWRAEVGGARRRVVAGQDRIDGDRPPVRRPVHRRPDLRRRDRNEGSPKRRAWPASWAAWPGPLCAGGAVGRV